MPDIVSIHDVAKRAGVSITTVSRVVNGTNYPVSKEARTRVLEAVEDLNYVPNRSAQALRAKNGSGIALIVRNLNDPYFKEIEDGVIETAMKNDTVAVVFNSMQDTKFEMRYYQLMIKQHYEGVIIGGGAYGGEKSNERLKEIVAELNSQGCKVIALAPQGFDIPLISVDNIKVGYLGTSYLIKHGHKKIGYIGGFSDHLVDNERFLGYKKAIEESGLTFDEDVAIQTEYSEKGGQIGCKEIMSEDKGVTAVYCSNDHIAYGAMDYLESAGIRIPEDVSVMGTGAFYDNNLWYDRGLTSIAFPFYDLGAKAVDMILNGMVNDGYKELLDVRIAEKKSVATI